MKPSQKEIEIELAEILSSRQFREKEKLSLFLFYLVLHEAGDSPEGCFKEIAIGQAVFKSDYDPKKDSHVRVEMGRLREWVAMYYMNDGRESEVLVRLPEKGYRPTIVYRHGAPRPKPETSTALVKRDPMAITIDDFFVDNERDDTRKQIIIAFRELMVQLRTNIEVAAAQDQQVAHDWKFKEGVAGVVGGALSIAAGVAGGVAFPALVGIYAIYKGVDWMKTSSDARTQELVKRTMEEEERKKRQGL